MKQISQGFCGKPFQGTGTRTPQRFRQLLPRFGAQPHAQLAQRSIQRSLKRHSGRPSGGGPLAFPNDVQQNTGKRGIGVVPVCPPTRRLEIYLDVTAAGGLIPDLNNSLAEIWSRFEILKAGMKHLNRLAVQSLEPIAPKALVLPDNLEQTLRRRVPVFVQHRSDAIPQAPLAIKAVLDRKHLGFAFVVLPRQSQVARAKTRRKSANKVAPELILNIMAAQLPVLML